jgi:hypothetical protein
MKLAHIKLILISFLMLVLFRSSVSAGTTFIEPDEYWRFFRGTVQPSEPNEYWKEPDFNDSDWEIGQSGFGYGDNDDNTELLDMRNNYVTVYIRKEFPVSLSSLDPNGIVQLVIDYDDGFIAYLNGGDEVERRHMPAGPAIYTTLANSHEAGTPVIIPLGTVGELLNDGNNVLAIEGHNTSYGSSDFSLIPALRVESDIVLTENTTWSGTQILEDNIIVPAGIILTIEPGTVVMMDSAISIKVYGQLLADGNESEPIRFTRNGTGKKWKQIIFIEAEDSRLVHCIIEFSDCEGDHKDYYDDDCDDGTVPPSRTYFQAVVALASHIDIEGCTFQNLPDDGSSGEGDAIAIISDDPDIPGEASANITDSQFLSIGQAVHTRYSYVLVEDCFFTDHHGDNDDVDLYGESTPVPLIRNNFFFDSYDDYINPTRCSAVFIGNVIIGGDRTDHCVVLRDKCSPIMMNNLIYNCNNGAIAVQNQCDALLVNNTIVDSSIGLKFFDHTGRWDPPYCLFPGSGRATAINCIIWDCATSLSLTDSPYTGDRGSHAEVYYCNIEGGEGSASVSAHSTLTWGVGNINSDPQFADVGNWDFHLKSTAGRWNPGSQSWVNDGVHSPCIDTGDPNSDWTAELWPHGKRINIGMYGGTAEASMSSSTVGNIADLNNNDIVNLQDFALFSGGLGLYQHLLREDLDRNGFVDFKDAALFFDSWLWEQ